MSFLQPLYWRTYALRKSILDLIYIWRLVLRTPNTPKILAFIVCQHIYCEEGGRESEEFLPSQLSPHSRSRPLTWRWGIQNSVPVSPSQEEWKQFTTTVLFFSKLRTCSLISFSPLFYFSCWPLCCQYLCPKFLVQYGGDAVNVTYTALVCLSCLFLYLMILTNIPELVRLKQTTFNGDRVMETLLLALENRVNIKMFGIY